MTDLAAVLGRARWPVRLAYLAVLLLATLTESGALPGSLIERASRFFEVSLAPRDLVDAARNVILFAGWGLVWMATAPARAGKRELWAAVISGFLISLSIETLQLTVTRRTPSIMDVVTNSAGTVIGALALINAVRWIASRKGRRSFLGIPMLLFAGCQAAAVMGEAFLPLFRQNRFPTYGSAWNRLRTAFVQFEWSSLTELPAEEFFLFAPAGAFMVAALFESGIEYKRAAWLTAGVGVGVVLGLEILHGVLPLPIVAGAIVVHALAIVFGAVAAAYFLPRLTRKLRGAHRPAAVFSAYGLILLLWTLRPYLLEGNFRALSAKLAAPWWIPLAFARERMDLFTVFDVVLGFLLFLPVGALLAVWPLRRRGWLRGILPALAFIVVAEGMQLFVAGRTLAIDDMLVAAAGVLVGWVIVRRAGFKPYGSVLDR